MPSRSEDPGAEPTRLDSPVSEATGDMIRSLKLSGDAVDERASSYGSQDIKSRSVFHGTGPPQTAEAVEPGSSADSQQLPSPLLPPFEGISDHEQGIVQNSPRRFGTPPSHIVQASPSLPRSPRMFSLQEAASPRLDLTATLQAKLARARKSSFLDLSMFC